MSASFMLGSPPMENEVIMAEEEEEEQIDHQDVQMTSAVVLPPTPLCCYDVLSDEAEVGRFQGHTTPVLSISYAPQANLLLTGGDDETIRLFDVSTRAHLSTFQSADWLPSPVRAVAISPDGSRAFIAARENVVKCVRVGAQPENEPPIRFEGHDHWVRALSLHWESRRLATAGNDSSVRLWNTDTGEELRRIQGIARAVAVSLTNRLVAIGSHDTLIRAYIVDDELAPPLEFTGHTDWVMAVALGQRVLLSGSADKTARVFDLESHDCICVLRGHTQSINAVALCKSERRGVTGANDSAVIYWSLEDGGSPLLKIASNFGSVRSISFLSKANEVCFSGWDGSIRLFDLHYLDRMRLLAMCAGGHDRLGKSSLIRTFVNPDLLMKIRGFMYLTADIV